MAHRRAHVKLELNAIRLRDLQLSDARREFCLRTSVQIYHKHSDNIL